MKYVELINYFLAWSSDKLVQIKNDSYKKKSFSKVNNYLLKSENFFNLANQVNVHLNYSLIFKKQNKIFSFYSTILKYNPEIFFQNLSLDRVFFSRILKAINKPYAKILSILPNHNIIHIQLFLISLEYLLLLENRLIPKKNYFQILNFYSNALIVEKSCKKFLKVLFQKQLNKWNQEFSKNYNYFHIANSYTIEIILYFKLLYYEKKKSSKNSFKILFFDKYLSTIKTVACLEFSESFKLIYSNKFNNLSFYTFLKKIFSLVFLFFMFLVVPNVFPKVFFKNILYLIGDFKFFEIFEHLNNFNSSYKKILYSDIYPLIGIFLERSQQKIKNIEYLKKYFEIDMKYFSLEKLIKASQNLNFFRLVSNNQSNSRNNRIISRINKRLFKNKSLFTHILFSSSQILEFLNIFVIKYFFNRSNKIIKSINNKFFDILYQAISGFHFLRIKILKFLSIYYRISSFFFWFIQEFFLHESNSNFLCSNMNSIDIFKNKTNILNFKNFLEKMALYHVKIILIICFGFHRIRFSRIYKKPKNNIKFIFRKFQKNNENLYYHFLVSLLNLFNIKIFLKNFGKIKKRIPVGYNIFWKKQNLKDICFYLTNLKKKIKKLNLKILKKKFLNHFYKLKKQSKYIRNFQDCGDSKNMINWDDKNFLVVSKILELEHLIYVKNYFSILIKKKFFLANLPKIKNVCNSRIFLKKLKKTFVRLKTEKFFFFYGICCVCFLNLFTKKKYIINSFWTKFDLAKNFFLTQKNITLISKIVCNQNSCNSFFSFNKNSYLEFSEFFKIQIGRMNSINLILNLFKNFQEINIIPFFSNFVCFYNYLVLSSIKLNLFNFKKILINIGQKFDFLLLFIKLIRKNKDPLNEFFFHNQKKNLYFFKKNLLDSKNCTFSNPEILCFLKTYLLIIHFLYNYNRFSHEKFKNFTKDNQKYFNLCNSKIFLKKNFLNHCFFYSFKFMFVKVNNDIRIKKRMYTDRIKNQKKCRILFKNSISDSFIFNFKCSIKSKFLGFIIKNKVKNHFIKFNKRFLFRIFSFIKNEGGIKNLIYYYKANFFNKNNFHNQKSLKKKFFFVFFWIFILIRKIKNHSNIKKALFPFLDLIVKNNIGDIFLVLSLYFIKNQYYIDLIFYNEYFEIFFKNLKKSYMCIFKNTRNSLLTNFFLEKLNNLISKKILYNIYVRKKISIEHLVFFFIFKNIYNKCYKLILGKIIKNINNLISSGNICYLNLINIITCIVFYFILVKSNLKNFLRKEIFNILKFSLLFFSLNSYSKFLLNFLKLYYEAFDNKQKLIFLIYSTFSQLGDLKIKNDLKKKGYHTMYGQQIKLISYNKLENIIIFWIFLNSRKDILNFSNEFIIIFFGLTFIQNYYKKCEIFIKNLTIFLDKKIKHCDFILLKKLFFISCTKIDKNKFHFFLNQISKYSNIKKYIFFNTHLFLKGCFFSNKINFLKKLEIIRAWLKSFYLVIVDSEVKKKIQSIQNNSKMEHIKRFIYGLYGYLIFSLFSKRNHQTTFYFIKKILKNKINGKVRYLEYIIEEAFKWKTSLIKLFSFLGKLLNILMKKIISYQKTGILDNGFFQISLHFIINIIQINNRTNLKINFSKYFLNFFWICKNLFSLINKYIDQKFDQAIIFFLNKKEKIDQKILKFLFLFYFEKIVIKINEIEKKDLKKIISILCNLIRLLDKKFLKIQIFKIRIITIIFTKFLFSKISYLEVLGLKGVLVSVKKKILIEKKFKILKFIFFLIIKSNNFSIRSISASIIVQYFMTTKNSQNNFKLLFEIILSFLENEKKMIRKNSLEMILKIMSNIQTLHKQLNFKKLTYINLFHLSFDNDFHCRFLAGLISKYITLKINLRNIFYLHTKLRLIKKFLNAWASTRIQSAFFWIYYFGINLKDYILIKTSIVPNLNFFFQLQVNYSKELNYLYLKFCCFHKTIFNTKNKWFTFIPFILKKLLTIVISFIHSTGTTLRIKISKIFLSYLKIILNGNFTCLIHAKSIKNILSTNFIYNFITISMTILNFEISLIMNFIPSLSKNFIPTLFKHSKRGKNKKIKYFKLHDKIIFKTIIFINHQVCIFSFFSKKIFASARMFLEKKNQLRKKIFNKFNIKKFTYVKKLVKILSICIIDIFFLK